MINHGPVDIVSGSHPQVFCIKDVLKDFLFSQEINYHWVLISYSFFSFKKGLYNWCFRINSTKFLRASLSANHHPATVFAYCTWDYKYVVHKSLLNSSLLECKSIILSMAQICDFRLSIFRIVSLGWIVSAQYFKNCFALTAAPAVSNNVQEHLKMMAGVKIFRSNKMRSFIKMIALTKEMKHLKIRFY